MPKKRVEIGSRDYCHNCGAVIVFAYPPEEKTSYGRRYENWFHILGDSELVRTCPGKEILFEEDQFRWRSTEIAHHKGEVDDFSSPKAIPKSYCMESVQGSWYSNWCLRPIKDEELRMCGIHAGHIRRAKKKRQEEEQHSEQNDYLQEIMEKAAKHIEDQYGLELEIHARRWHGFGAYFSPVVTGKFVVDGTELLKTLDALRDEESF